MTNPEPTNETLLRGYQNGDFSSFDLFYKKNHKMIFCYLLSRTNKKEIAEDLLQETFLRIHKYILKYDSSKGAMSWVFTIAHHALIDHWHKVPKSQSLTGAEVDEGLSSEERLELKSTISNIMASLGDSDQVLFRQRLVEDLSFEDIARKSQISSATARQRISRMLKKIRSGVS